MISMMSVMMMVVMMMALAIVWEVQGDVCFIKVRQLQSWLSEFQWKALSNLTVGDDDDDAGAVDEVTDDDDWTLEVETKSEWDWHHSKQNSPSSNP